MDHEELGAYTPEEEERLKRIEEELEKARETKFAEPESIGLDSKMQEIEERARSARREHAKYTAEGSSSPVTGPETGRFLGRGMQIAYAIIGLPLFGAAVGWFIDQKLHTSFCVMIGVLIGAVGGIAFAVKMSDQS